MKILIILFSLLTTSCAGYRVSQVSVPESLPLGNEEISITILSANRLITEDKTTLTLPFPPIKFGNNLDKTGKYFFSPYYQMENIDSERYFVMEILLEAKIDEISFNPREVTLNLRNGKSIKPNYYYGPTNELNTYWRWEKLCDLSADDFKERTHVLQTNKAEKTCIALIFTIPPPQQEELISIDILGLKKSGIATEFRDIRFTSKEDRKYMQ